MREELHKFIDKADDQVIRSIYKMLSSDDDGHGIVGYSPKGEPLTQAEIIERVNRALEEVRQGKTVPMEDVSKEAQTWL